MKTKLLVLLLSVLTIPAIGQATRKILVEEFTGDWCGYCPEGHEILDNIITNNPNRIVAVGMHYNDFLESSYSLAMVSNLSVAAYPRAAVDRFTYSGGNAFVMSRSYWTGAVAARLNVSSPVTININPSYNPGTRILNVTVDYTFLSGYGEDTRITCLLIEDSISSSQTNYYNTTSGSPFYGLGNPIPNYQQLHTQVALLSADNWGDINHPATVASGQSFSKSYSYTLPATMNDDHVKIVAFINERVGASPTQSSGTEILNSEVKSIWASATGMSEVSFDGSLQVSPNPFSMLASIGFNLRESVNVNAYITDLNGKFIKQLINEKRASGKHDIFWAGDDESGQSVSGGIYLVHITTPFSKLTSKLVYMPN